MMKITLRISSLFFGLVLWGFTAMAQNDHCSEAIELTIYASEEEAVLVDGDTRISTDGLTDNVPVCSANFFRDDVWFCATTSDVVSESGYAIRVYCNDLPEDMPAFGLALYNSCDAVTTNEPFFCGNADGAVFYWDEQGLGCFGPNQKIYIRVWSAAGDAANWQTGAGTFRIAIFPRKYEGTDDVVVLWGDQPGEGDFAGGLNGWTAEGISCFNTGPENALWEWNESGWPYWLWGGQQTSRLKSKTLCNGAMIFESMFMDIGPDNIAGSGTCPQPHEGALVSPVIDLSGFNSPGVSVLFNQSMQRFSGGEHWVDYSIDGGLIWEEIQINTEKTYLSNDPTTGDGYYNEQYRVRLPGAQNVSSLIFRFRFTGEAYWWIIDDVKVIETECTNTRVNSDWYTTGPWAMVPMGQAFSYPVMADVENVGACAQTNASLNHTVRDEAANVIYDETLDYGMLDADEKDENRIFPMLVSPPNVAGTYHGEFMLTQDDPDFNTSDNSRSYQFAIGGNQFALEDGATTPVSPALSSWTAGVPRSWAMGNYFNPAEDVELESILWGLNNATEMAGFSVNVILYQWTDSNNDNVASDSERKYIGYLEYAITGNEPADGMITSVVENFVTKGEPIILKKDFGYIAMIEHQALNASDPVMELLGSTARNYRPLEYAFDSLFQVGMVNRKFRSNMLAIPMDGMLGQIDYGVDRFGPSPTDFVPVVRLVTTKEVNTVDNLPIENLVTVYPNPVIDQVQIKLEFAKPYTDVKLRLVNNLGQIVYYKTLNQTITQHTEAVNLQSLPSGNYMLQVVTVDGQRSIPVVVIK